MTRVFDHAFALQVMAEARRIHRARAERSGEEALRRFELLRARFEDGLAIRQISAAWNVPAAHLHREYARARSEFQVALLEAVAFHSPGATQSQREAEIEDLLAALAANEH